MGTLLRQCSTLLKSTNIFKSSIPTASLMSKDMRDPNYQRAKPYDYENKPYRALETTFDKTIWRFDENTALIHVEGPTGVGKSKVAKELAEKLDFKFMPDPPISRCFQYFGENRIQQLKELLPEYLHPFTEEDFHRNPFDHRSHAHQFRHLLNRTWNEHQSHLHIASTGQGVVTTASMRTYFAYLDALISCGMLNPQFRPWYDLGGEQLLTELFRPHIVIYLDAPYEVCKNRIEQNGPHYEASSPVLNEQYYDVLSNRIKKVYLPYAQEESFVMVYDWSYEGSVDEIIHDIEQLPWLPMFHRANRAADWIVRYDSFWTERRRMYSEDRMKVTGTLEYNRLSFAFQVPELLTYDNYDLAAVRTAVEKITDSMDSDLFSPKSLSDFFSFQDCRNVPEYNRETFMPF